jgi:hypothetical protein
MLDPTAMPETLREPHSGLMAEMLGRRPLGDNGRQAQAPIGLGRKLSEYRRTQPCKQGQLEPI